MIVSPSILSCDFSDLKSSISQVSNEVEYLHIDVMDGIFVPNISFGAPIIKSIRPHFTNVFDVHLMIYNPLKYIEDFAKAGADIITFHYESHSNVRSTIKKIKSYNIKAGLSIKPKTRVISIMDYLADVDLVLVMSVEPGFGGQKFKDSAIKKIRQLADLKEKHGYKYQIEVDGGINKETINLVREAGVEVVVAGSYVFKSDNPKKAVESLR